jgi:hypothetical protein
VLSFGSAHMIGRLFQKKLQFTVANIILKKIWAQTARLMSYDDGKNQFRVITKVQKILLTRKFMIITRKRDVCLAQPPPSYV